MGVPGIETRCFARLNRTPGPRIEGSSVSLFNAIWKIVVAAGALVAIVCGPRKKSTRKKAAPKEARSPKKPRRNKAAPKKATVSKKPRRKKAGRRKAARRKSRVGH